MKDNSLKAPRKIILIVTFTALVAIAIWFSQPLTYNPIQVTIEIIANQDETCQILYDTGKGFNKEQIISKPYNCKGDFKTVKFILPEAPIHRLRIDPGYMSDLYHIRKIHIEAGKVSKTYSGDSILAYFNLVNLRPVDSMQPGDLLLTMVNSPDVQMLYKLSPDRVFALKSRKISGNLIILFVAYVLIVVLLITRGGKYISRSFKKIFLPESTSNHSHTFPAYIYIIIILIKLVLVSVQQMSALTNTGHDCSLFIKLAYSLSNGDWLGSYNLLTLIKGFGYPLFISITNYFGIPLFLAEHLLYAFAVLLLVKALSPLIVNQGWRFALFVILMFNPAATSSIVTTIMREGFFYTLSLIVVAGFTGMYLRRKNKPKYLFCWGILTGIALFIYDNTREEGLILLPFLIILSILTLIPLIRKSERRKKIICTSMILLPYMILIVGNTALASVNYITYGSFIRNEIRSKAFSDAYSALTKIDTDCWIINVPVPKEARLKAYEISPTFSKLKEHLENENNYWTKWGRGTKGEIKGGWFMWAFRAAANVEGYHQTLPKSQNFYRLVAKEINTAFEEGKLKKKKKISLFVFSWDNRLIKPVLYKLNEIIPFVIKFKGYSPYPYMSVGKKNYIAKFQNITNEIANINTIEEIEELNSSKMKYNLLNIIASFYRFVNPIIFFISLLFYIVATSLLFVKKVINKIRIHWIIASIFFFLALSRMLLIAYISVSQWEAMCMRYLGQAYPFLLLFEFWVLFSAWFFLQRKNRNTY